MQYEKDTGRTASSTTWGDIASIDHQKSAEVSLNNHQTLNYVVCSQCIHVDCLHNLSGYYARVTSIRTLMKKFISLTHHRCQVVNLGAGFDTTYWQLQDDGCAPQVFIEVDFPAVTARKIHFIK